MSGRLPRETTAGGMDGERDYFSLLINFGFEFFKPWQWMTLLFKIVVIKLPQEQTATDLSFYSLSLQTLSSAHICWLPSMEEMLIHSFTSVAGPPTVQQSAQWCQLRVRPSLNALDTQQWLRPVLILSEVQLCLSKAAGCHCGSLGTELHQLVFPLQWADWLDFMTRWPPGVSSSEGQLQAVVHWFNNWLVL